MQRQFWYRIQVQAKTQVQAPIQVQTINPEIYSKITFKLREFFQNLTFFEVHAQSRLSILSACEDPTTISTYNYSGQTFPLIQTGQMTLEEEILKNPEYPGLYCVTTSYRNEPNPKPGRHDLIFPMFEFECKGDQRCLIDLEKDLLEHLGFGDKSNFVELDYSEMCRKYNVKEICHDTEEKIGKEYGPVVFLKDFPNSTSPFWNMAQNTYDKAKKVDVLLYGVETIGSAERNCDKQEMKNKFYSISDGQYANRLFAEFGKQRVEDELDEFLGYDFFTRSGGGIGLTRLIRAMSLKES